METLMHPQHWGFFEWLSCMVAVFQILSLFLGLPAWWYIGSFLFWRLSYNVGLGLLLRNQSNSLWFTRIYETVSKQFPMLHYAFAKSLEQGYNPAKYPIAFKSWLAYRWLVDLVLGNDVVAYAVLCFAMWELPESLGLLEVSQYLLGVILCFFNVWAKWDAHRVLGDFAWYWGDFFFLVDKSLVFDGIFQMFPHPMYTVGYAFYYGMSLITRSYTVLFLSMFAHVCQLSFLAFAEDPHIQKTYSSFSKSTDRHNEETPLLFLHLDSTEAADMLLVILALYNVTLYAFTLPLPVYISIAFFWRIFHDGYLGVVLKRHSDGTKPVPFRSWKRIYNASLTLCHLSFILAAHKFCSYPSGWDMPSYLTSLCVGLALIALNVWCSFSTYSVLGDYGWFYGDFFEPNVNLELQYSGIYRFLNNPETVMGFAGYYGAAILSHSVTILLFSVFAHGSHALFVHLVEEPHMRRLYKSGLRRHGGFSEALLHQKEHLAEQWEETKKRLKAQGIDLDRVKGAIEEIEGAIKERRDRIKQRFHSPSPGKSKTH